MLITALGDFPLAFSMGMTGYRAVKGALRGVERQEADVFGFNVVL